MAPGPSHFCFATRIALAAAISALASINARAQSVCAKADFEAVVEEAAGALRDLNAKNKPIFQEKLRELKTRKAWTQDQFLQEAAPFVRDDKIEAYDQTTEELLSMIAVMGQEGPSAEKPDCTLLPELRAHMTVLIETQAEKWSYMFTKIASELAK
jgi:hypothetical protein